MINRNCLGKKGTFYNFCSKCAVMIFFLKHARRSVILDCTMHMTTSKCTTWQSLYGRPSIHLSENRDVRKLGVNSYWITQSDKGLFWLIFRVYEVVYIHVVACRLPETSTLLTYLILNRKRLVSGSDFPYLSVCRRSVAPCSGRDDVEAEVLVLRLVAGYGS